MAFSLLSKTAYRVLRYCSIAITLPFIDGSTIRALSIKGERCLPDARIGSSRPYDPGEAALPLLAAAQRHSRRS